MDRKALTHPDHRLPVLELPRASDGAGVALRSGARKAAVLVLTHELGCGGCGAFLAELMARQADLEEWDGTLRIVAPAAAAELRFPAILIDTNGRVPAALGTTPPAVVIADQWGEIHAIESAGEDHRFPPFDEITSWLRYLAMKCPECEGEAY